LADLRAPIDAGNQFYSFQNFSISSQTDRFVESVYKLSDSTTAAFQSVRTFDWFAPSHD
jgi:hypothetical protein